MIKKWYKHYILKESLKEIELNRILDKISKGETLTIREDDFLNLYNQTQDGDLNDYAYLSRYLACDKIDDYLKLLNDDYRVERLEAIRDVVAEVMHSCHFYDWMRQQGKEGGSHKFPRVLSKEKSDLWEAFLTKSIANRENAIR